MYEVILYSNSCPRCLILKNKLDKENIEYEVVSDIDEIMKLGFKTVPLLGVNGKIMSFPEAMKWCDKQSMEV